MPTRPAPKSPMRVSISVNEANVKTGRRDVVRAAVQLILLGALATPAGAEPLELFGYAGVLGEWELTASVRENGATKDLVGPLTMTHVGICTVDSPEEKGAKSVCRFHSRHRGCRPRWCSTVWSAHTAAGCRISIRER